MLARFKWITQLFMHVCSFDANRLCMLLEKNLEKWLWKLSSINVTTDLCTDWELSVKSVSTKEWREKNKLKKKKSHPSHSKGCQVKHYNHCPTSSTNDKINQTNLYLQCDLMGTMEIQHRSDQGLSWDHGNSLGFSRAFLFLPLRTKHWPLHPSIPYWEHRGSAEECWMSMVRLHQHLWREGDGGSLCDLMSLCTATAAVRGQEWKCTHTVKVSIPTNCQKTGNSVTLTSDQWRALQSRI